jgi:hypothetical protein
VYRQGVYLRDGWVLSRRVLGVASKVGVIETAARSGGSGKSGDDGGKSGSGGKGLEVVARSGGRVRIAEVV